MKTIPRNPRKWVIIYDFKDDNGRVYMSQEEYDEFLAASKSGSPTAIIRNRIFRTNCITSQLERELSFSKFEDMRPEDKFEWLQKEIKNVDSKKQASHWRSLLRWREPNTSQIPHQVAKFCAEYDLWEMWLEYFGEHQEIPKTRFDELVKEKEGENNA